MVRPYPFHHHHSEHGTGAVAGQDLVDRLYYYTPRRVMNLPPGLKIVGVPVMTGLHPRQV